MITTVGIAVWVLIMILLRFGFKRRAAPEPDFVPGQRVRIVRMDGCMAHVRGDVKGGAVVETLKRQPYGAHEPLPFVRILMDDGTYEERVALRCQWTLHDGCLEYRY